MKKYSVTFHGETPLLIHRDNIQWGERVQQWTKKPKLEVDDDVPERNI